MTTDLGLGIQEGMGYHHFPRASHVRLGVDPHRLRAVIVGKPHPSMDWSKTILRHSWMMGLYQDNMDEVAAQVTSCSLDLLILNVNRDNVDVISDLDLARDAWFDHPPKVVLCVNGELPQRAEQWIDLKHFDKVMHYPYRILDVDEAIEDLLRVRFPIGPRILFRLSLDLPHSTTTSLATGMDVSMGGALVVSERHFPLHHEVAVKVMGTKDLSNHPFRAMVVRLDKAHSSPGKHCYGLKFEFPNKETHDAWCNFVETL